jgi:tetratricopeptide (TPR) repeat protein
LNRWLSRRVWILLFLAGALEITGGAEEPAAAPATHFYQLFEQARRALIADEFADASRLFDQVMATPAFREADTDLQYYTFLLASFAADGTDDHLSYHEYLVIATGFPKADGDTWLARSRAASILEKWSDCALALTMVARKWPGKLAGDEHQGWRIKKTVFELGRNPALRAQRTELLEALYQAEYKSELGVEPSHLWLMLATDALEQKDLSRAREISRRIKHSTILVSMRIDKRFDVLIAAEPRLRDVRAAADREAKYLKAVTKKRPKSLHALVQYANALFTLGKFDTMLSLANDAIARMEEAPEDQPPYEDIDDNLNWLHNSKANALVALGRLEESAEVLANWERSDRNRADKVSQAINLGAAYNWMGRPDDALKAVDGLDWSRGMSEYGRMQYQRVRFRAYLLKGMDSEAREIVEWIREHQDDAPNTAQSTLLEIGDIDDAAALLVSRLRDVDKRAEALEEIQKYRETPHSDRYKEFEALEESMLSRPDVAAVIAEYGRREKFPIYR